MVAAALPTQPLLLPAPAKKPNYGRRDFFPLCPDCGQPMHRVYAGKINGGTNWKYQCRHRHQGHSRLMGRTNPFERDELIAIARNRAAFTIKERKRRLFWAEEEHRLLGFESREAILLPASQNGKVIPFPDTKPKPEPKKKPTVAPFTPKPKPSPSKPAAIQTTLMHALRMRITAHPNLMSHIVLMADFQKGNFKRQAGDPLCKPLDKFPHGLTDFVPPNDPVCPKCAELAERYDLPLPGNAELTIMPSSRLLGPDDPPVKYDPHSKWFNYNFGFPFNGYLRQWGWLRNHCVCKQCGSPVSAERGSEPVKGMEIFDYYTCTNGHPIRDERDLKRSDRQPKGAGSADEVIKGYPWLKAAVPDDIPF